MDFAHLPEFNNPKILSLPGILPGLKKLTITFEGSLNRFGQFNLGKITANC